MIRRYTMHVEVTYETHGLHSTSDLAEEMKRTQKAVDAAIRNRLDNDSQRSIECAVTRAEAESLE